MAVDLFCGLAYVVTCRPTGKRYIGITSGPLARRWREHVSAASTRKCSGALARAIAKYGASSFAVEPVAQCCTWGDLRVTEQTLILRWGTLAPGGYNLTLGGEGAHGCKHSPESIERSAAKHRGRPCHPNTRRASSEYHSGKPKTDAQREKIGAGRRGIPRSPETKAKLVAYWAARRAAGAFKTTRPYAHAKAE